MCISAAPAHFAATILYAGEVALGGRTIHVLGYENTVQNLARPHGRLWRRPTEEPRGNAMILHFPAVPGTMSQANVVDTEACPGILRSMVSAVEAQTFQ